MKRLFHSSRGFTLIELMVVMTIMSILAAIVVPAVTGTTTAGRGTTMTADVNTVQNAVERFVGDHPKGDLGGWPTASGNKPTAGEVSLPLDWGAAYVDKQDGVTVKTFGTMSTGNPSLVNNGASDTTLRAVFGSTYLRTAIPHAGAFITGTGTVTTPTATGPYTRSAANSDLNDAVITTFTVDINNTFKPNITVASSLVSTPGGWAKTDNVSSKKYAVWRIDTTGKVFVALAASEY